MDKAAHWRLRALSEWQQAPRTWLMTATFPPIFHYRCFLKIQAGEPAKAGKIRKLGLHGNGVDWDKLSEEEQFLLRHNEAAKELTLFYKRLRKEVGPFRYFAVAEKHEGGGDNHGMPHYHVLLHELTSGQIKHAAIKRQWRVGFVDAKLVTDRRTATYACKYLTKSADARVRASQNYGGHEYFQELPPYAVAAE